jgi:hypothetical protein
MALKTRTYKKNGFDIEAVPAGNERFGILYRPYGEKDYVFIGEIHLTTTAPCGGTRQATTWSTSPTNSPIFKKSWHEAAKDLYSEFLKSGA